MDENCGHKPGLERRCQVALKNLTIVKIFFFKFPIDDDSTPLCRQKMEVQFQMTGEGSFFWQYMFSWRHRGIYLCNIEKLLKLSFFLKTDI